MTNITTVGLDMAKSVFQGRKKSYCEDDDDVMAKQGDRGRPNPRRCPSVKLDPLTGRRSTDSIRARSQQYAASRDRTDDCNPPPSKHQKH